MMLVRRRATVEPQQVTKPQPREEARPVQTIRRLRVTSVNAAIHRASTESAAKEKIDEQLKLISDAERQIDDAQVIIAQAYKMIDAQLRLANLRVHSNGSYIAEIKEQWTNQTMDIDSKKFRNKVSDEAFWGSISVSVMKAKNFLTKIELEAIADVKPGMKVGETLKVSKIEPKKRSRG